MRIISLSDATRFDTIEVGRAFVLNNDTNCIKISDQKVMELDIHYGAENQKYMPIFGLLPDRLVRPARITVEF
jgi:hypothetical protein